MKRLIVVAVLVAAGCGSAAPAVTGEHEPRVTSSVEPTATPKPSATRAPTTPPTPAPTATPEATVDPVVAFDVFRSTFDDTLEFLKQDVADAIEADYYWIDSVDKTTYDPEAHRITFNLSVEYESVYLSNRPTSRLRGADASGGDEPPAGSSWVGPSWLLHWLGQSGWAS